MFLGSYHFDGDPADLLAAYDRMMSAFPASSILWHTCVVGSDGITVYDACPTEDIFSAASSDPAVLSAMASAGLPPPTVERLGPVHHVQAAPGVLS